MGGHAPHRHAHDRHFDSDRVAADLELEGELSSGLFEQAIAVCAEMLDDAGVPVRRVVDLGCGPGVGTALLLAAFESATVVAVDGSPAMLDRAQARAARLALAARLETRRLDLDRDLRSLGRCELAWAAMAIHHADDEVATLSRIGSLLDARGLVCLLERADPSVVRFSRDLGRPGIWDRLEHARSDWFESVRERLPGALNAESYPSMLAAAGLDVVVDRTLSATAAAPHDAAMHQFVAGRLQRRVGDLAGFAAEDDLDALRRFAEATPSFPEGRWEGATITTSRKLLIGRPTA